MEKTSTVFYDGEVLRLEGPVDLEPNTRYRITIHKQLASSRPETAWEVLDRMAGTVEGPEDWSKEHDHYLYGTPKRRKEQPS